MSHDTQLPHSSSAVSEKQTVAILAAQAWEVIAWLVQGYAFHRIASPESSPGAVLEYLVQKRLEDQIDPHQLLEALDEQRRSPYLLETAVLLLRHEGSWPADPKTAFLAYSEILLNILELAPVYDLPWQNSARGAVSSKPRPR